MIFNMVGGGGGSGATLVVSSPANVSVTVSKDDKSYTKNSGSLGSATFKGLATGTWTVTISGNGQTATKTIEITADYAITIAFFSASINITYPATSTCVVTNSSGQTVASDTNTGSSTKTWTATVNAAGTYTVTATATDGSGKSKSQSVSITTDGQSVSVTLSYADYIFQAGTGAVKAMENSNGANQSISIGTDSIVWSWNGDTSYSSCAAYTSEKIDLTNYEKLFVRSTMSAVYNSVEQYRAKLAICSSVPDKDAQLSEWAAYVALNTDTNATLALDISSISGSYYVALQGARTNGYVFDIWLE